MPTQASRRRAYEATLGGVSPRAWLDRAGGCGRAVPVRAEGGGRRRRGRGGYGGRPDLRRPPARVGGSRRLRDPPGPPGVPGQRHRDTPGHRRVHQRAGRRPRGGPPGLGADRRGARAPSDPRHHSARGQSPRGGDARGPGQAGLGQVHPRRGRPRVHRSRGPRRGLLAGLDVRDAAFRPARRDALRLGRQRRTRSRGSASSRSASEDAGTSRSGTSAPSWEAGSAC